MEPEEDFILIIDADMVLRRTFDPIALGAQKGWAVAAYYGYMKGVNNALALKHIPEVAPRNDTLAGPHGRRGDQVRGGGRLCHCIPSRHSPQRSSRSRRFQASALAGMNTRPSPAWKGVCKQLCVIPVRCTWCSAAGLH